MIGFRVIALTRNPLDREQRFLDNMRDIPDVLKRAPVLRSTTLGLLALHLAAMSADSFDPKPAAEQIDAICLRLFDSWCDTRNVISLTFLLRCWPLISLDAASLRQLCNTLGELQESHGNSLADEQADLLVELKRRIDDLQVHGVDDRTIIRHSRDRAWAASKLLRLCRIKP